MNKKEFMKWVMIGLAVGIGLTLVSVVLSIIAAVFGWSIGILG